MGRPAKIYVDHNNPQWCCHTCGMRYGSFRAGIATWHQGVCGACSKETSVTEPRDYGYFLAGWLDKRDADKLACTHAFAKVDKRGKKV